MGGLRWLIVVPLYFFTAMVLLPFFILVARLLRLRVPVDPLVTAASSLALGLVAASLVAGWVSLAHAGRVLMALIATSFALSGLDALLQSSLPLPLDEELLEDEGAKKRPAGIA